MSVRVKEKFDLILHEVTKRDFLLVSFFQAYLSKTLP